MQENVHFLHKLTFSTSKIVEGAKEESRKKMCTSSKKLRFILSDYSFKGKESKLGLNYSVKSFNFSVQ